MEKLNEINKISLDEIVIYEIYAFTEIVDPDFTKVGGALHGLESAA